MLKKWLKLLFSKNCRRCVSIYEAMTSCYLHLKMSDLNLCRVMFCLIAAVLNYPCSNNSTHSFILFVYVAGLGQLDVSGAELSSGRELDSVLGAGDHDSVTDLGQVTADTGKLPRGHLHYTAVLLLLEGQMGTGQSRTVCIQEHIRHQG